MDATFCQMESKKTLVKPSASSQRNVWPAPQRSDDDEHDELESIPSESFWTLGDSCQAACVTLPKHGRVLIVKGQGHHYDDMIHLWRVLRSIPPLYWCYPRMCLERKTGGGDYWIMDACACTLQDDIRRRKTKHVFYTHDEIDRVARLMSVLMSLHQQGFTRLQLSVTSVGVKTHEPFDLIAYPNVFAWTHKDLLWDDWNSRHVNGDRKGQEMDLQSITMMLLQMMCLEPNADVILQRWPWFQEQLSSKAVSQDSCLNRYVVFHSLLVRMMQMDDLTELLIQLNRIANAVETVATKTAKTTTTTTMTCHCILL